MKRLADPRGGGLFDSAVGIRRPPLRRHGTLLIAVLAYSGCTTSLSQWWHNGFKVGPQYCQPSAPVADHGSIRATGRVQIEPAQDCAWWTVFSDSTLNGLIESAVQPEPRFTSRGGADSCRVVRKEISRSAISSLNRNPQWPTMCTLR